MRTSLVPFNNSTKQLSVGSNLLPEEPLWIYLSHLTLTPRAQIEPTNRRPVLAAMITDIPYNATLCDSYRSEHLFDMLRSEGILPRLNLRAPMRSTFIRTSSRVSIRYTESPWPWLQQIPLTRPFWSSWIFSLSDFLSSIIQSIPPSADFSRSV